MTTHCVCVHATELQEVTAIGSGQHEYGCAPQHLPVVVGVHVSFTTLRVIAVHPDIVMGDEICPCVIIIKIIQIILCKYHGHYCTHTCTCRYTSTYKILHKITKFETCGELSNIFDVLSWSIHVEYFC